MAWKVNNKQSFNRAWIFTLLVVFGMTLFSCEEDEMPVVREIQKTAQAFLSEAPELVEITKANADVGEENLTPNDITTGQFHVADNTGVPPEPEFIEELLGELEVVEEIYEIGFEQAVKEEVEYTTHIAGGLSWSADYAESIVEPYPVCEVKMSGLVYPNPAKNQTTLKVTMPNAGAAEIQLFSLNGQNIRTIHSGRIQEGDTEYPINLVDLETGMYLVVIVSDGKKETVKFSKI